jgi:hypothetical protein
VCKWMEGGCKVDVLMSIVVVRFVVDSKWTQLGLGFLRSSRGLVGGDWSYFRLTGISGNIVWLSCSTVIDPHLHGHTGNKPERNAQSQSSRMRLHNHSTAYTTPYTNIFIYKRDTNNERDQQSKPRIREGEGVANNSNVPATIDESTSIGSPFACAKPPPSVARGWWR